MGNDDHEAQNTMRDETLMCKIRPKALSTARDKFEELQEKKPLRLMIGKGVEKRKNN